MKTIKMILRVDQINANKILNMMTIGLVHAKALVKDAIVETRTNQKITVPYQQHRQDLHLLLPKLVIVIWTWIHNS